MVFDEDRSRTRKGHGQENFALLRRLAVSVLKNAKSCEGVHVYRELKLRLLPHLTSSRSQFLPAA